MPERGLLTWGQFKELVKTAGIGNDDKVAWIDWNDTPGITVERSPWGLTITGRGDWED